ncbi:hypothetical protein PO909_029367 [Leuciscus waleckii]
MKMPFLKEESEQIKIEETLRMKQEDTEEQTKMLFIKEESEEMKIEETLRMKQEDTEEQTKMSFIKEESEEMKIEDTLRMKHEDTGEQTVWKKTNTPKGDQIAVKRVSEMTPSTTRAGIKRPVTQEDREWARASLLQLGRFTGIGWILSPDSPN